MENVKYCVILRKGKNVRKEQYFPVSGDRLKEIFSGFGFDNNGICYAWLGHIAGQNKGEVADELKIDKKSRLLEFKCENEQTANKCAKYFNLPLPFSDAD